MTRPTLALPRGQAGVVQRRQLLSLGWSWPAIRAQLEGGRWRELNEHVVVTHNGPLTKEQQRWAAYLSAPGLAATCGATVLEQCGVTGFDDEAVHLLVQRGARPLPLREVQVAVHESRRFTAADVIPGFSPPATSLARAAVDAAAWSASVWSAYRVFVAPVQQRRLTAPLLRTELRAAGRVRHCRPLRALADDLCGGAEALSEVEFLRFCRRHGFAKPQCQRRMDSAGRWRYLDATFRRADGRLVRVEVDGGIHLTLAVRSRDTLKDNDAVLDDQLVLRFVSIDVYADNPRVVAQLRRALELSDPRSAIGAAPSDKCGGVGRRVG